MRTIEMFTLLAWIVFTGCDDASPPATKITVTTHVPPALIAFRDGPTSPWQPPTRTPDSATFELDVHDPYEVVVVCDHGGGRIDTLRAARTPDDDHTFDAECFAMSPPTVTGQMVQPGRVAIGPGATTSSTPNWTFMLEAAPGTYDLGATDAAHLAIRRGIVVTGPTTITPPIDVVQEGTALVPTALTATNTGATDQVDAIVRVLTPTTLMQISFGPAATAPLVPAGALAAGDKQLVAMTASDGAGHFRLLARSPYAIGDSTTFAVPPPLGPVHFAVAGATLSTTWSTLPDYDVLHFVEAGGPPAAMGR